MRQRLNLVLVGVVLVLVAIVIFEPGLKQPVELPKLTELEQVQQIRIEKGNNPPLEFKKDPQGQWQIVKPVSLPANHFRIKTLLELLSKRDYTQLAAQPPLKLAELKLEPPEIKVSFDNLTLSVGDRSPLQDGKRYVQLSNKPNLVFLLTDDFYYTLTGNAMSFIDLSPLGEEAKLSELRLPDYHLVLKDGSWKLISSRFSNEVDTRVDALTALVDNWEHAQAISVEAYVKGTNQGDIFITLKAQSQALHFIIQSKTPDLVLARPDKGVQYKIHPSQVDKLLNLPKKPSPAEALGTPVTAPPK